MYRPGSSLSRAKTTK